DHQHDVRHRQLHSCPTRRSSDLDADAVAANQATTIGSYEAEGSAARSLRIVGAVAIAAGGVLVLGGVIRYALRAKRGRRTPGLRSEEHTSELQSLRQLVCRLLLE